MDNIAILIPIAALSIPPSSNSCIYIYHLPKTKSMRLPMY